ncbi:MAG: DUF1926 domain-containing protein [Spirochaetaceae bacterium]|jgi:hypothetical protein|nr:DUF1926 domain-containing protein [Spirochaetaceae bacterium]
MDNARERSIILCFNYHLPVGSSDAIFEQIYCAKLKPFIQILHEYPQIPFAVHLSGTLLYKIERQHPEFFMLLAEMVQRKQIELIGGGFYEPAMPLLFHDDRIGQIELLTTYLQKQFDKRVNGCWIHGKSWETQIISAIETAGLLYTFIDEEYLLQTGFTENEYNIPCISEDKGKVLGVFPVFSSMRREILKKGAAITLDELLKTRTEGPFVRTVFPDFFPNEGSIHLAKESYIHNFFEDISAFTDRINFSLPGVEFRAQEARQRVYIPSTMNKKHLSDYPEAGLIYGKMTRTKKLIEQMKGDKERKHSAQEDLWRAQDFSVFCNYDDCENSADATKGGRPYPGILNPMLRGCVYKAMLEAERSTRNKLSWKPSLIAQDLDMDGAPEYLFQGDSLNAYVRARGASLFEFDSLPVSWNYQNTLSPHTISTESPVKDIAVSFYDIVTPLDYGKGDVADKINCRIIGDELYKFIKMDRIHQTALLKLPAREGPFGELEISKDYKLTDNIFTLRYVISNTGSKKSAFSFITNINLSFPGDSETVLRIFAYNSYTSFSNNGEKTAISQRESELHKIEAIDFQDLQNELIITISSGEKFDARLERVCVPYKTALGEIVDAYQWTRVVPKLELELDAGEQREFCFKLGIFH